MKERPKKRTVTQVLKAIENTGGIKQLIASKLAIHRHTLDLYEKRYPTVAQALHGEVERVIDKAESNVFQSIQEGNVEDSWKLLRFRGKSRGYVEKTEFEGEVKSNIHVQYDIADDESEK